MNSMSLSSNLNSYLLAAYFEQGLKLPLPRFLLEETPFLINTDIV